MRVETHTATLENILALSTEVVEMHTYEPATCVKEHKHMYTLMFPGVAKTKYHKLVA